MEAFPEWIPNFFRAPLHLSVSQDMKVMNALFLNHGGGPLPLLGDKNHINLVKYLSSAASQISRPKAILIASAHWEEPVTTFVGSESPGLLYDYYGFPPESYEIKYSVRNSLDVIKSAMKLLEKAGMPSRVDPKRKYDHGVFVPLKLMYPNADVPIVQISLPSSRDPELVFRLGEILAPLRGEGVLIIGSGLSYHNLPSFFTSDSAKPGKSIEFDTALKSAMLSGARRQKLLDWRALPYADFCHPAEDHLMPLVFVAGAGAGDPCRVVYEDTLMGAKISGFSFQSSSIQNEIQS